MALLAIDQGNTRTKFGLFSSGRLQRVWTRPTHKEATAQDLARDTFPDGTNFTNVRIGLCSVVPELTSQWRQMAHQCDCECVQITGFTRTILRNTYATPETLGPDRLMTAVAAATRLGTPVIPISLGTAIVVDAVSPDGAYLGGMIAPGISVVTNALTSAASALGHVTWREPASPIGRSSHDAMTNGLFYQCIGGLRAMISVIRDELGDDTPLAVTGGWATAIAPHLSHVALVDEYLVLHGIDMTLSMPDDV